MAKQAKGKARRAVAARAPEEKDEVADESADGEETAAAEEEGPAPEGTGEAPDGAEDTEEDDDESADGEVTVKYKDHAGKETERTFSKKVHGKDYKKLADEFKATNKARLVE